MMKTYINNINDMIYIEQDTENCDMDATTFTSQFKNLTIDAKYADVEKIL